jgi:hypothetical protein
MRVWVFVGLRRSLKMRGSILLTGTRRDQTEYDQCSEENLSDISADSISRPSYADIISLVIRTCDSQDLLVNYRTFRRQFEMAPANLFTRRDLGGCR